MNSIRIATYNIHKCVGLDRKFSPERIVDVLREIDADVIALQEVLCHFRPTKREHQAEFIAAELDMDFRLGENRQIRGGDYGNATLTRFNIDGSANYDITVKKYEARGCLWTNIGIGESSLQFFNVHMGTSFFERRKQVQRLLDEHIFDSHNVPKNRLIAGDFNEWTSGLTTRLFKANFNSIDARIHLGKNRTYPGIVPLVHLDHVYFDPNITLMNAFLHRSKAALIASDHLPVVADFQI
ncbi:MAG TPA: endonuclease/exonuclease/phosphatase family protein [Pyrinomonadaceae bacterium]|nr:endonuclease/exonuclease/phosphatase family protein [Pyrinomonadaceae bacterium]